MPIDALNRARLVVVTGKGGTGKTTVAAALAVAAAQSGRHTLLAEVEGRQGLAALFGRHSLAYRETRLTEGVNGLAVDPDAALRDYLGRYGFAPLARLLSWAKLTTFITAAAPGLGDMLLVGKVWEAVTRRQGQPQRPVYDLVVMDAPPTGRVVPFLRAPETVAELARIGPLRHQADRVKELLDDPEQTAVLLTCLPEELPVTETLEGAVALRAAELPLSGAVVVRVTEDRLGSHAGRLSALARDPSPLATAAKRADVELSEEALAALVAEGRDHQRQIRREHRLLKELRAGLGGLPVVELPLLSGGTTSLEAIRVLAERLAASELAGAHASRDRRRTPRRGGDERTASASARPRS
ncbi:MAG TPA: ArsA-related P-loop ATPase [Actinomycetes bacterium]|jgi:anion-transporting  ArsA/GET3 family ATPase|nr:ArsA-related P-loop ATPase [Actinomycetes bacterium]